MKFETLHLNTTTKYFVKTHSVPVPAVKGNIRSNQLNYLTIFVVMAVIITITSCKRYLEVGPPKTQLSADGVFESDAAATAALAGIYTRASEFAGGGTGSVTNIGAHLSDECDSYSTAQANSQLADNQLIPTNIHSTSLWANLYIVIYQCNLLLEGLKSNPYVSSLTNSRITGEALFLRAYAHLTLASYYGAVPIITTSDFRVTSVLSRSPLSAVYSQVITDLKQAGNLLGENYAAYGNERIGASKWGVKALLARCYLYSGDYNQAKAEASSLIANSIFSLNSLSDVFLKNSTESILQIKPANGLLATPEGNLFILTTKPSQLALSNIFLKSFESGDLRKSAWTNKITVAGVDYHYPFKYKTKNSATLNEYSVVFRLAETYLIRAEALARLGENAASLADLDALRARAGLPKLSVTRPSLSGDELLDAVLQERRIELFTEWNHRWVDLQRFSKAIYVLPLVKPDWKPTAQLLPLPDLDIRTNPNLIQNNGYQ